MRHRSFSDRLVRPRMSQPAGFNLAAAFSTSFLLAAASQLVELPTYWAVALIAIVGALCSAGAIWLHITGLPDAWRLLLMVGVAAVSTAASRRGVRTSRRFDLIRPAEPSASTVVARPAGFDPVAAGRAVPALATGIHR
jgi:hypothetical protein